MPHAWCISHRRSDPGGRVVSQVPRALSPTTTTTTITHHYRVHYYYHDDDLRLCLACASAAIRQQVWSGSRPGWGFSCTLLLIRYRDLKAPPVAQLRLAKFWGNTPVKPLAKYSPPYHESPASYRSGQPCDETNSIGRISQPPLFFLFFFLFWGRRLGY